VSQVLKTLSQVLESKRTIFTADDLTALPEDARDGLLNQTILVPSRPATHVTCDACHDDHVEEVTRIKGSTGIVSFRIRCPEAGWVEVAEERLRQWAIDVRSLVALLSAAVDSTQPPEEVMRGTAWRLATIEIAGESYDVVFVRLDGTTPSTVLNELGRKHPPARTVLIGTRDLANDTPAFAASLPLPSAFMFTGDQVSFQLDRIRSIISAQSNVAGNVFQLRGDFWQLSFDGTTKFSKDSVGMGYIARLLAEPDREIPAVTLLAARAGIDPLIATGSSGEILDDEARENYARRYRELKEDLEAANQDFDLGRVEKLESEMEQLTDELAKATGLRGNPRQKYDADKVRKSVSMAVSRDIDKITEKHEAIGRHLTATITSGLTFRYAPEHKIDWLT
jgi:flagellar motility protein MotE (MotC chaperone)